MICPLEGIRAFLPHLPHLLVPREASAVVEKLSATLPEGMSHFGVECRLDADQPQVDFSLGVQWIDGGREALTASLESHPSRHDPAWATIRGLCADWSDRASKLYFRVSGLWLEFDLDGSAGEAQPPSVFVLLGKPAQPADRRFDPFEAVVERVLEQLVGRAKASALHPRITSFADALPSEARLSYVAVMLPRPSRPVRVIASGVPAAGLASYLDRIDWQTPKVKLEKVMQELSAFMSSLSLEVSETSGSRIDLEFRVERSRRSEQWPVVFEKLRKLGLASEEKCEALRPWWAWRTIALPDAEPCALWSSINHVKITCAEELPLAAKAYLSAGIGIFPPDAGVILLETPLPRSS